MKDAFGLSQPALCPPALAHRGLRVVGLTLGLLGSAALAQTAPVTPLTLEAALARLAQSPSVTQAQLAVQVAQTNLNASRAALGLSVSVTGNAAYTGSYSTTVSGTATDVPSSTSGSAGVSASLGILPWSSAQTSLRSAQRSLSLAEAKLIAAQNSARLNVVQQYLNAVVATQDIVLADKTLALRQRQLTVAQTQKANGNATDSDVLSAQAAVQSAQAAQLQASASLQSARLSLGAALGSDLSGVTFPTAPNQTFTLPDVNTLVAQARTGRWEVLDAQNTLGSAQDNLDQLRRDATLPDVTASLRYGPAGSGGLNASLNLKQGTLGAGYSVPFGDSAGSGGNRVVASVSGSYVVYSPAQKAQISAAQANVTQAQLTVSVQQQTIELDVRTKYSAAQASLVTLQSSATQVQVAELGLSTAKTRLQAGTGTADDVTTAELALAQAQRNLSNARATAQINVQALLNAAGGLQ